MQIFTFIQNIRPDLCLVDSFRACQEGCMYLSVVSRCIWYMSVLLNDKNVCDFSRSNYDIGNQ